MGVKSQSFPTNASQSGPETMRNPTQTFRGYANPAGMLASADVAFHRHGIRLRSDHRQPRSADLFEIGLQFTGRQPDGPGMRLSDDDLRAALAVFDDE